MCFSVIVFRESRTADYKPGYRTPLYPWVQIIGIIAYMFLILTSSLDVLFFVVGICLFGIMWYYWWIKEPTTFSAAIYPLFGRIAKSGMQEISEEENELTSVAERAIFIDLEEENSLNAAIKKAAHAIEERLGGEREKIGKLLHDEVVHWIHSVKFNISISPVLLEGIEQPEMIIMRGEIKINDKTANGLIILLDDKESSVRLLKLVSQLEATIKKESFPDAWEKAESAKEIKDALIN